MILTNLTHCSDLRVLQLNSNELTGPIPDQLSSLSKLLILRLSGKIPAWIGNFSLLSVLGLTRNNLVGGILNELGRLSKLEILQLYGNQLSSIVPPSIYNLSSIYYFSVTKNHLHGKLPPDVGLTLPNLQIFAGGVNNFKGTIHISIANASRLVNNFKGTIPVSITNASRLEILDFAQNNLTETLPASSGRLRALYWLHFDDNKLGYGKNGDLNFVNFLVNCSNLIYGNIPFGIGNLVNLNNLAMEDNLFTGNVPDVIGKLQNLQGLSLNGPIPSDVDNLINLMELDVSMNNLTGEIPSSIASCTSLEILHMEHNKFQGTISLLEIDLSHNNLSV
ncbi:hypothetical protein ACSBR2_034687 [Camellia fascicularis]